MIGIDPEKNVGLFSASNTLCENECEGLPTQIKKKKKKSQVISQKTEGFSYSVLPFLLLSVLDAIFMQPQGNRNHKGIVKKTPTL